MKKKKMNTRSVILNGIAILFSALIMIFYACPHFVSKLAGFDTESNGFDCIKAFLDEHQSKASATIAGVMILIVFITAVIVCLLAIVNLLSASGVIKNLRILKVLNVLVSGVLTVAGIVAVICVAVYCNDVGGVGITYANGWANIVNMILAILTCAVVSIDCYTNKK